MRLLKRKRTAGAEHLGFKSVRVPKFKILVWGQLGQVEVTVDGLVEVPLG